MTYKLLLLFCVIVLFSAFKSGPARPDSKVRIIKLQSLIRPQDSTVFTYGPDGRITAANSYFPKMWKSFVYTKNRVEERGSDPSSDIPYKNTFYLNSKGLADSMLRQVDTFGSCYYFKYDKDKRRTEEASGCDKRIVEMKRFVQNGNIVKQVVYNNGMEAQTLYFDYYPDKPNVPTPFSEEMMGYGFRGKDSKNLLRKIVMVRNGYDTALVNTPYYHFDDKGRVSTIAIYGKRGALNDSILFTY